MWYRRVDATRSAFDVTFSGRAAKACGDRCQGAMLRDQTRFEKGKWGSIPSVGGGLTLSDGAKTV